MPLVDSLIALVNQATASDVALALGAVLALSTSLNFVALLHALFAKSAPSPPPPSPTTIQYIIQPPARATYDAEYESDIAEEAAEEKTSRANARRHHSQTPPNLDPIIETITTEGALASAPQKPPLRSTGSIVEEALREQEQRNELVKKQTPMQILEELKAGNARFAAGEQSCPTPSLVARREFSRGQVPKVMVIGCADSRVPIEILFDQGIGDVFVSRNAGNLFDDKVGGTLDYAVNHLGIRLVVVMGHEACGAVRAAGLSTSALMREPPHLRAMLLGMQRELALCKESLDAIAVPSTRERATVIANAVGQARKILEDPLVHAKHTDGKLLVVAAYYEITTGLVQFIELPKDTLVA